MIRMQRSCLDLSHAAKAPAVAAVFVLAALAGGCSADVGRFDFPGLGVADKDGAPTTIPRPTVPMRSGGKSLIDQNSAASGDTYAPPAPNRDGGVRMAALPESVPQTQPLPPVAESRRAPPLQPVSERSRPEAITAGSGQTIEVQPGDTLYGLSKKHKVPLSELMGANGLTGPALKPGQKLVLPASAGPMRPGIKARPPTDVAAAAPALAAPRPAAKAANWDGSYVVKPGDSIYVIARRHKVTEAELQEVNGIADPRRVKPGTALKVPAEGGASVAATAPDRVEPASTRPEPAPVRVEPVVDTPRAIPSTTQPTIINGNQKVASRGDTATDVTPGATEKPAAVTPSAEPSKGEKSAAAGTAAASTGKLRWPVKGKIVTGFGPRPDGTHNDGVNVSVPQGTEVHAAEGGTVAYAGAELKGYGNLILLRHDNGWVTAYAHNEDLLVKRGDRVKRGQVLSKAGKTGQVDQPQLHFELRQGSKPVDPTPFMEKM